MTRERTRINEDLLSRLPRLKLINQTGKTAGHRNLKQCSTSVIINTVRKITQAINGVKESRWQTNIGSTISVRVLGIRGYGKIDKTSTRYAQALVRGYWSGVARLQSPRLFMTDLNRLFQNPPFSRQTAQRSPTQYALYIIRFDAVLAGGDAKCCATNA